MNLGPLPFFFIPLASALIIYPFRRWAPIAATLSVLAACLLALLCLAPILGFTLPLVEISSLSQPFLLLGREFRLLEIERMVILFAAATSVPTFLYAWPISQGRSFFPIAFIYTAFLNLALSSHHLHLSTLSLWIAATFAVYLIQAGRPIHPTSSLRFIALTAAAACILLIASHNLDRITTLPEEAETLQAITYLLLIGFGILLMVVPFYGNAISLISDAPPLAGAFVFSTFQAAVLAFLARLWTEHPNLPHNLLMSTFWRWSGWAALILGGTFAAFQTRWGRLLGYATLANWGITLLAISEGHPRGLTLAFLSILIYALSLLIAAIGLSAIRHTSGSDQISAATGLWSSHPHSLISLFLGLASLAGLPGTPGFSIRWAMVQTLRSGDLRHLLFTLLASAGITFALGRAIHTSLTHPTSPNTQPTPPALTATILTLILVPALLIASYLLIPTAWLTIFQTVSPLP